jgi:RsiW-degrading membrane proteinase PrsW (M82 family)
LITIPAGFLNGILIWSQPNPEKFSFIAGITEESLKFLALYWYLKPKVEFNEPMDAIVYGVLISLGFATLENIEYVYLYNPDQSLVISIMRAFTAIPLHSMCGVIMGFMFGFYIFYGLKKYLVYSILIPIIIHSTYNFLTDQNILIFLVYMISIIFYTSKLFLQIKKLQSTKLTEAQEKIF